jgi:protoporphyrinogen/coproporphyrinogen III oxidase
LGIAGELIDAPARVPRFLLINGELRAAPLTPPAFFASPLFGAKTKWSVMRDVFGHSAPPESDESVADFTRRKFTAELLDKLVGPFVSGIYAGDPEKLSVRAAFPQLYEAERSAGSVVRGMIRGAKERAKAASNSPHRIAERRRPRLQTFRDGNETLTKALAAQLGAAIRTNCAVAEVRRSAAPPAAGSSSNYSIVLNTVDGKEQISAENLVLATPTDVSAQLLRDVSPDLSGALASIEYAPIAVVSLGYPKSMIRSTLDGFGFLIPRSEKVHTLGTVWNSSLFSGRAPTDCALLTSFVGGATDPDATLLSEAKIAGLVHSEIAPIVQIAEVPVSSALQAETAPLLWARPAPVFSQVKVYRRALPQYNLGHSEKLATIRKAREAIPGLFLTGNYFTGPSISACIELAFSVAEAARTCVNATEHHSKSDSRTLGASGARV